MFDDFYGLRARPFQLTPDPAFYFESLTHRKALSYLSYGLAQGEGFIVITGEIGAGKSTLAAHLLATIDRARLTAAQVVTSRLDGADMVRAVALAFGLTAGNDKPTQLAAIEGFLHDEARAGRRTLLVVDETQNLSIEALEELRMLSNFQLGAHPLLQILLLGQPEFRDSLKGHARLEQLRQRIIAAHHLEPMLEGEIESYVMHRLKLVGWCGNPGFEHALFARLHAASSGIPRRINQIINRLLILGAVEQRSHIDTAMLEAVLAELDSDGGLALSQAPVARAAAEPVSPPVAVAASPAPEATRLAAAMAERDAQIAELQEAVIELAEVHDHADVAGDTGHKIAMLGERLNQIDARLLEQDRTIRHMLTMLIEWIERDEGPRAAA